MKMYRCHKNYYSDYDQQIAYFVGQICSFEEHEKFAYFDEHFEEIEL
jgi:hypothetical protein